METVSGTKRLTFNKDDSPVRVAGMEMYIDGVLSRRDRSLKPIEFDTNGLTDGHHEIRIVFIAANEIQTSCRTVLPVVVNNNNHSCILTTSQAACGINDTVSITFAAEGATSIRVVQHQKELVSIESGGGFLNIDAKELGRGSTTLRAIATINGKEVSSRPLGITVNGPLSEDRVRTGKK